MWWWRCCLTFFKVFWPWDSTIFCNSPAGILEESLAAQSLLLTVHWDDIETYPLPGSFVTFHVDWKFLIIALMEEMGIFTALVLLLKPLHWFVKLDYLLLHIRNILFVFFSHCDGWLREFGLCFPSYLYFCETGCHGWITSQVTYVTMVPRVGNETLRPLGVATGNASSVTRVWRYICKNTTCWPATAHDVTTGVSQYKCRREHTSSASSSEACVRSMAQSLGDAVSRSPLGEPWLHT